MTIQSNQATQYKLFDTTGLKGGQYKVEIQFNGVVPDVRPLHNERTCDSHPFDRELTITSSTTQNLADALAIAHSLQKGGNARRQVQVDGQSAVQRGWPPVYPEQT